MTTEEKIEVIKAYDEGKDIEFYDGEKWNKKTKSIWDFEFCEYRIKPQPTRLEVANQLWKDIFGFENFTSSSCPCSKDYCDNCKIGGCSEMDDWWNTPYEKH